MMQRKVGTTMTVLVDAVDATGGTARSAADAPEIDGTVYVGSRRPLRVGEIATVKIERADGSTQVLTDIDTRPPVIRCTLPQDLQPGAYVVHYKVLATDGHATQGVLRFTLAGSR